MKYEARVTLTRVEYRGDNLGSNIRITVTVSGRSVSLRFRIKPGESQIQNQLVYDERTDANEISLSSSALATEVDPVHDDTGSAMAMLRFDDSGARDAVLNIPIQGDRKGDKSKKGVIVLTFSGVLRETGERFVAFVEPEGWLKVKSEDSRAYPNVIPFGLRVTVTSNDGVREFFTIEEGQLRENKASVALKEDGSSYLQEDNPQTGAVTLRFSKRDEILTLDGREESYWAVTDPNNPIPSGTYDLELPYELHSFGAGYRKQAAFARTWFRVGHSGDRFLHVGSVSLGCVTVRQVERWDEICALLITARKGDLKSIGQIIVI
jgi:hypothetical protein